MLIRRWRRCVWTMIGVILMPPLFWVGLVAVGPTGWAKRRLVSALESRSGRPVKLEQLSLCLLGGVCLTDLEIGSPGDAKDPWLKVADLRIDVSLMELIRGHLEPRLVEVDGLSLRLLRRSDGTVELADLLQPGSEPTTAKSHDGDRRDPGKVAVQIRHASVSVVDEPTETRILLADVDGEGHSEGPRIVVDHLSGTLNGGPFRLVGKLDMTAGALSTEGQFLADDVVLDEGMSVLRYVVPVLAGAPAHLKGRLHSDLYLQGRGESWENLCRSFAGRGTISINPIDLNAAPLISELSKIADIASQRRIASVRSDFMIKDRRITTDHFTLNIGRIPLTMSGWTDLDGRLDYRIKMEGLTGRLPERARRILGELDLDVGSMTTLTLQGTLQQVVVNVNGVPLDRNKLRETGLRRDDRERLKLLGQQLRDKLTR